MLDLDAIRALLTNPALAWRIPMGINDRKKRPVYTGDRMRFADAREWGSADLPEWVMQFEKGKISHPGATSDIPCYCEVIEQTGADPAVVASALLAEVDRLTSELGTANDAFTELSERARMVTRPYLILDDPEGIIGCVEATSPEAAWEVVKAENPDDYSGDPGDNDVVIRSITAELYGSVVDDLEIARSELVAAQAELAAAKAGKAVEWTVAGRFFVATVGRYEMIVVPDNTLSIWPFKWQLSVTGTQDDEPCSVVLGSGPETGESGKAACFAAYLRACGMGGE